MILLQYQNNGFKILVSNDYDQIIEQIIQYFRDVSILCSHCPRRFISLTILRVSIKWLKEMRIHIAVDKLPRHVKGTFYCEECDRVYPIRYMD